MCSFDQWPLPPSVYLGRHWHHSCDKWYQAFPLHFCILQPIKNWMVGRPGNEANSSPHEAHEVNGGICRASVLATTRFYLKANLHCCRITSGSALWRRLYKFTIIKLWSYYSDDSVVGWGCGKPQWAHTIKHSSHNIVSNLWYSFWTTTEQLQVSGDEFFSLLLCF